MCYTVGTEGYMATKVTTLKNAEKTDNLLPRTELNAIFDSDGNYLDSNLKASDLNALKGGAVDELVRFTEDGAGTPIPTDADTLEGHDASYFATAESVSSLLTPTTIWSGDIHATGGSYTVSEAITNFMALQFVFNVIPSRSPSYDVQADQSFILPFVGRYDLSSVTGGVSAFGIEFTTTTDFTVYTYSKATSYDAGLVRIIGLFRLPN